MTVWWCKRSRMYSLKSWALWRKTTSSCRRTVCWQELHTRSNHSGWNDLLTGLVTLSNSPLRKHYNVCAEGCLLDLSAQGKGKKRPGPIEEQAIPSLKLSYSFAVRLFCALSACFMHVFSLLELLTEAVHAFAVHVSRQCGCHEGLKPQA